MRNWDSSSLSFISIQDFLGRSWQHTRLSFQKCLSDYSSTCSMKSQSPLNFLPANSLTDQEVSYMSFAKRPLSYHETYAIYFLSSEICYSISFLYLFQEWGRGPGPSMAQLLLVRHGGSMPRAREVNVAAIPNFKSLYALTFLCPTETQSTQLFIQYRLLWVCLVPEPLKYNPFTLTSFKTPTSVERVWSEELSSLEPHLTPQKDPLGLKPCMCTLRLSSPLKSLCQERPSAFLWINTRVKSHLHSLLQARLTPRVDIA